MAPSVSPSTSFVLSSLTKCAIVPMSGGHRRSSAGLLCRRRVASSSQGGRSEIVAPSDLHDEDLVHNKHMGIIPSLKKMLSEENDRTRAMITVDSLKRLCIDYHFPEEIDVLLRSFYHSHKISLGTNFSVFDAALSFTLLREGGYDVSSDMFQRFISKNGEFDMSISSDIKGLLNLHDASHLNMGEEILYKAHKFTSKQLKSSLNYLEPSLANVVREALEHPYHLSLQKYKVKHHLTYVQRMFGRNDAMDAMEELVLIEDRHNRAQHQVELMQFTRWWRDLGLAQELPFARDQAHKWYMCAMAIVQHGPAFSKYRLEITKVISFIYVVDDIFDLVGSLEELSLFTDVVKRWDITDAHSLPSYMRSSYLALYNVTAHVAELVEKEHGYNPIYHFRKAWAKLFDAFMVEAKWFATHQVPTVADYLRNGAISSGVHVVLVHAFFLLGQGVTKDARDLLELNLPIITSTAKILRLWDDLGSASDEGQCGFDGSYKDCYMNENPTCSSEDAKQHIMHLISEAWEELNNECFSKQSFTPLFQEVSLNLARMVRVMYTYDEKQKLPILEEYTSTLLL